MDKHSSQVCIEPIFFYQQFFFFLFNLKQIMEFFSVEVNSSLLKKFSVRKHSFPLYYKHFQKKIPVIEQAYTLTSFI